MAYTLNDVLLYKDQIPKHYYVVILLWAANKNYSQIANELQIPIGTVKSRTYRAQRIIDKLREANAAAS